MKEHWRDAEGMCSVVANKFLWVCTLWTGRVQTWGQGVGGLGREGGSAGINSVKVNDFLLVCIDKTRNRITWRGRCVFSPACSRPTTFLGM